MLCETLRYLLGEVWMESSLLGFLKTRPLHTARWFCIDAKIYIQTPPSYHILMSLALNDGRGGNRGLGNIFHSMVVLGFASDSSLRLRRWVFYSFSISVF